MMRKTYQNLLNEQTYSKKNVLDAALIIHPNKIHKYGLKISEIAMIFEEGSNFTRLKNPIIDEFGNKYRDSEWYYMAKRIDDLEIKKLIAFCSIAAWLSKNAAYLHKNLLNLNLNDRIDYMREAIQLKFDNNPQLKTLLMNTWDKEIIEYTYWWDTSFGIDHITNKGKNILWKLLMEYRDNF